MKVFISYAREDVEFVDRLSGALVRRGFEVLIDRKDIPALDDWKRQLERMIRSADATIFVLSPDWLTSDMCAWELERATKLGKRLAPIVCRATEQAVPAKLASIQFVIFAGTADLDQQAELLANALKSDADWSRAHTRYQELAQRWDELKRPDDHCLAENEVRAAKRWLSNRPAVGAAPTQLQREFIERSSYIRGWTYKTLQALSTTIIASGDRAAAAIGQGAGELFKYLFRFVMAIVWVIARSLIYFIMLLGKPYYRWLPISVIVGVTAYAYQDDLVDFGRYASRGFGLFQQQTGAWEDTVAKYKVGSTWKADVHKLDEYGANLALEGGASGLIKRAIVDASAGAISAQSKGLTVKVTEVDHGGKRLFVEPQKP